jgi:hypothetical protein
MGIDINININMDIYMNIDMRIDMDIDMNIDINININITLIWPHNWHQHIDRPSFYRHCDVRPAAHLETIWTRYAQKMSRAINIVVSVI